MSPMSNDAWLSKGHGDYGGLLYVDSSIGIVSGMVRGLVRYRCASGVGEANRARAVFLFIPESSKERRPRESVSASVSGMTVSGVVGVASIGSGASDWDDP